VTYTSKKQFSAPEEPHDHDGQIDYCLQGYDWSRDRDHPPKELEPGYYALEHTFTLPADADALYLIGRGALAIGNINIDASEDVSDVEVSVQLKYNLQKLVDDMAVCILQRGDNERGLGIFVRRKRFFRQQIVT
jgi:hypothetical protein